LSRYWAVEPINANQGPCENGQQGSSRLPFSGVLRYSMGKNQPLTVSSFSLSIVHKTFLWNSQSRGWVTSTYWNIRKDFSYSSKIYLAWLRPELRSIRCLAVFNKPRFLSLSPEPRSASSACLSRSHALNSVGL